MKHEFVIAISCLVALAGCANSEVSPQEKRNKFDKCVLDNYKYNQTDVNGNDIGKINAEKECADLLE